MNDNQNGLKRKLPLHKRTAGGVHTLKCARGVSLLLTALLAVTFLCGFSSGAVKEGARVFDGADLFADSEERELEQLCRETIEENRLDIVIVTTEDTGGKSAMEYADDFYDENGFGYEDNTGILLLIDMGEREIWISTAGEAIDYFTDDRIDDMVDVVTGYLSDGDYTEGAQSFVEQCAVYMYNDDFSDDDWDDEWEDDRYGSEYISGNGSSGSPISHRLSTSLLIAVIVGAALVVVLYMQQKNGRATDARTYLKNGSFAVTDRRDVYTHTTTVRHHIDTDNGSHGGSHHSSTHHSSSGASHGGGGGKF